MLHVEGPPDGEIGRDWSKHAFSAEVVRCKPMREGYACPRRVRERLPWPPKNTWWPLFYLCSAISIVLVLGGDLYKSVLDREKVSQMIAERHDALAKVGMAINIAKSA